MIFYKLFLFLLFIEINNIIKCLKIKMTKNYNPILLLLMELNESDNKYIIKW